MSGELTESKVARIFFTSACSRQTENASILTSTSRTGSYRSSASLSNKVSKRSAAALLRTCGNSYSIRPSACNNSKVSRCWLGMLGAKKLYPAWMPAACRYVAMHLRTRFDAAACFPRHQVAPSSALRAYSSQVEGKMVEPSAINQNTPAEQTAVSKKKCIPNQAPRICSEYMRQALWVGRKVIVPKR